MTEPAPLSDPKRPSARAPVVWRVDTEPMADAVELRFTVSAREPVSLHWGLRQRRGRPWQKPPEQLWPPETRPVGEAAVQTPFCFDAEGRAELTIRVPSELACDALCHVFFFPASDRWDNNRGRDYCIELPPVAGDPAALVEQVQSMSGGGATLHQLLQFEHGQLALATRERDSVLQVHFATNLPGPLQLHWGLGMRSPREWTLPAAELLPAGTTRFDDRAVQTPFQAAHGLQALTLEFDVALEPPPLGLNAVLFRPELGEWLKDGGRDLHIPLFSRPVGEGWQPQALVERIVAVETGSGSWTLMHRFELCRELLSDAAGDAAALAVLYVWLRYSAIRQLDWQRRYNTQPRELTHAQDRLTRRVAELFRDHPDARPWARLLLTTVGRGGEGQRIRDDILQIMHRHKIKEDNAYFMEQWHQKLHNNATADDIAICEACLALLDTDNDLEVFYRTLEERGITRERLRSYDRPITTDPWFSPESRGALRTDFEAYLQLLKSIHSTTDLDGAVQTARGYLAPETEAALDELLSSQPSAPAEQVLSLVSTARQLLARQLESEPGDGRLRDLLYVDLGLAQQARLAVERLDCAAASVESLCRMIDSVLGDLARHENSPELRACARHWRRLVALAGAGGRDWALHASSVTERMARAVASAAEAWVAALQPLAEQLGTALGVEPWTIPRFAEEVVRGLPLFVLSNLLRRLEPALRQLAQLGAWRVLCRADARGTVRAVSSLLALQEQTFAEPTVVIADVVSGQEEIPRGVTAVITKDSPDLLSHVAVRARNQRVLFASCYDDDAYARLSSLQGHVVELDVSAAGQLTFADSGSAAEQTTEAAMPPVRLTRPTCSAYALPAAEFRLGAVGGKSLALSELRDQLPMRLRIPQSMALPFGVFERVLEEPQNRGSAQRYAQLVAELGQDSLATLARLRETVLQLTAPEQLLHAVHQAAQQTGLSVLEPWDASWQSIKRVWASKWTDRAYLSRVARGIAHEQVSMAVLIQEVVAADYAFVVHTVNPQSGDVDEIYAELVPGLGETLVSNFPGRALGFVCAKSDPDPRVVSYPSKSVALHGSGLIFRSDSNAEDLAGYAGAGLYDSVTAVPLSRSVPDYSTDPLLWDADFRRRLLCDITELAAAVERARGAPQDIEGAVSGGELYVLQSRPQVGL